MSVAKADPLGLHCFRFKRAKISFALAIIVPHNMEQVIPCQRV